jgi:putative inorganic carbon (HCO3(-)) transporter
MKPRLLPQLQSALPGIALGLLLVVMGLMLAWLPWKWAGLCVLGGTLLLGLLVRPQYALWLLALAVPFGSLRTVVLGPFSLGMAELLSLLLLGSWLARSVGARRIDIPRAPLLLPLLAFLGAAALSTLPATSLELCAEEIVKWLEVLIIYLLMCSTLSPADPSARSWQNRSGSRIAPSAARLVVWAMLAAGSAEAVVGIYQFLRGVGPEGFMLFGRFMRAYGHFAQPNPFAGYLGLTLPVAYALTLQALATRPSWRKSSGSEAAACADADPAHAFEPGTCQRTPATPQRRLGIVHFASQWVNLAAPTAAFGLMTLAVVMSWSRGAWVGVAAALVAITVLRSRRALVIAVAAALLVVYVLVVGGARYLPPALVQRMSDFLPYASGVDIRSVQVTDANYALVERMAHWQAAANMLGDHPWLGVGIGNYAFAYARYAIGRWRDPLGHAHNYYLNIAAEAGLLGLSAYLLLMAACLIYAWRVVQRSSGYWRAVALGSLGVLVHLSTHNLFDNLFVHSMTVQVGLVLGLLGVAEKSASGTTAHRN